MEPFDELMSNGKTPNIVQGFPIEKLYAPHKYLKLNRFEKVGLDLHIDIAVVDWKAVLNFVSPPLFFGIYRRKILKRFGHNLQDQRHIGYHSKSGSII